MHGHPAHIAVASLKQVGERPDAETTWAAGYPVGPCAIALRNSSAS
jgi:hypothetical protein